MLFKGVREFGILLQAMLLCMTQCGSTVGDEHYTGLASLFEIGIDQ